MPSLGIYLHIPFCRAKCAYCDFDSYAGLEHLHERYVRALCAEIRGWSTAGSADVSCPNRDVAAGPATKADTSSVSALPTTMAVDTVYIGGGTPTTLSPPLLGGLLETCRNAFRFASQAEISVEANPGTVSLESLHVLRSAGVNRLSLGAQSFCQPELRLLQRIHSVEQICQAFQAARGAGFDNVNLDLIYGLPGQTLADWQFSLDQAVCLGSEHLSLYALSVEDGTPLAGRIAAGELPAPDPDVAAEMYALAEERLARAGYEHYELSNWAVRPAGSEDFSRYHCRHNLTYWRAEPYLGFGAGAHSYLGGCRYHNVSPPQDYVSRIEQGLSMAVERMPIGATESMAETMILGLRLTEGVRFSDFALRHGRDLREEYQVELADLEGAGLLARDRAGVRLTARGRLLGNQAFGRFWPRARDS